MSIFSLRVALVAAASCLFLLVACSDSDDAGNIASDSEMLTYVPADTPYLFAALERAPDDLSDKLTPLMDTTLKMYRRVIRAIAETAYTEAQNQNENVDWFESLMPFLDEMDGLLSIEGLASAGIDEDSQFAFYGSGLLPVLRVTLSDGELMESTIQRLEEKAEQKMDTATIDGNAYRSVGDEQGRVIVAILGNQFVATFAPTNFSDDHLQQVLGLSRPDNNVADAGTLAAIAKKHDYENYILGFVDIERIAATFIEPQTGVNAALLEIGDYDSSALSDVCKAEIRSVVGIMPRLVGGYSELSVDKIVSSAVFEVREDIAAAMTALAGPVPGLGMPQDGILTFGMGMDLLAIRNFYSDQLDALEAEPFACEMLAELQNGVAAGREVLNQPIPPIAYGFNGFMATIESIEGLNIAAQQPPTSIDARLLVAMENAEGLFAMAAMFSPEFAALNLESNGEPVRLSMPQIDALGQVVHIALTDDALAISVGDGMEKGLSGLLKSSAPDAP
ncbi:MAG: hypothetical protein OSB26_02420, partial [Woeseiaceae bacterium]|nr:hypothetical protein [Woeseiaceae bacterium]